MAVKFCRGTGKAKGFGCGKPLQYSERNGIKTYQAKYGLCPTCQYKWATENNDGKTWFAKQLEIKKRKEEKEKRKEFVEKKRALKTGDSMKLADTYFSRYIRLKHSVDKKCTCYTCGDIKAIKEVDNGHYQKREHKATRYHEDNCRPQCKTCNGDTKHNGKQDEFRVNLSYEIGEEKVVEIERLAKTKIDASSFFYREIATKYRIKLNELQKKLKVKVW